MPTKTEKEILAEAFEFTRKIINGAAVFIEATEKYVPTLKEWHALTYPARRAIADYNTFLASNEEALEVIFPGPAE